MSRGEYLLSISDSSCTLTLGGEIIDEKDPVYKENIYLFKERLEVIKDIFIRDVSIDTSALTIEFENGYLLDIYPSGDEELDYWELLLPNGFSIYMSPGGVIKVYGI